MEEGVAAFMQAFLGHYQYMILYVSRVWIGLWI